MCVAASVLYFCNLTQKEEEKKHSSVHTAKWRTDPVCCRILRLHFVLTGVQHACPPSLLDSVRVTHVRLPPARRRPAAAAGRRGQSLELLPWTAPGVSVASSQVSQLYDKKRLPKRAAFQPTAATAAGLPHRHRVSSERRVRAALRRLLAFIFVFETQKILDGGA